MVEMTPGGGGFTVAAGELAAGCGQVAALASWCEQVAIAVVEALAQMAGSAGHPGLASALTGAAQTGTRRFADAGALYAHTQRSLRQSAGEFEHAEDTATADVGAIMRGAR